MSRAISIHTTGIEQGVQIEFLHGATVQRRLDDARVKAAHLPLITAWLQRHDESFERQFRQFAHEELGLRL